jgi:hypothetical protein
VCRDDQVLNSNDDVMHCVALRSILYLSGSIKSGEDMLIAFHTKLWYFPLTLIAVYENVCIK